MEGIAADLSSTTNQWDEIGTNQHETLHYNSVSNSLLIEPVESVEVNRLNTDVIVLRAFVESNFAKLSELFARLPTDSSKVSSELTPVSTPKLQVTKRQLLRAIRCREMLTDPVKTLVDTNNHSLLLEVIKTAAIKLKKDEVKWLLQKHMTAIVLAALQSTKFTSGTTHPLLNRFDLIAEVCKLFENIELIPEAITMFAMIDQSDMDPIHFKELICIGNELISLNKGQSRLAKAYSPIAICMVLSDFLDSIKDYNPSFTLSLERLSAALVNVAERIKNQIKENQTMDDVCRDKSLGKHHFIEIWVHNSTKYRSFLQCSIVKQNVVKYWTHNLSLSLGFRQCSYVLKAASRSYCSEKLWSIHSSPLVQKSTSLFQFQSWVHNCQVRHLVETGCSIACLVIVLYIVETYINSVVTFRTPLDYEADDFSTANDNFDRMEYLGDYFFLPFSILTGTQALIRLLYKHKSGQLTTSDPRMPFDLIILVVAALIESKCFGSYSDDVGDEHYRYEYLWGVLIFSYAMRVFLCFAINYRFGPILRMMLSTFVDITTFLLILAMILLVYSMTFYNFFYDTKEYETIPDAFLTLLSAALGSFDFSVFETRQTLGTVFLLVWIVIATILILNILIALLSKRYEELAPQADADFVSLLITYISTTRFMPEYGGLVLFPCPTTVFLLPFVPLYFTSIDKVKLSAFLAHVSYLPCFFVGVICFALYNAFWSVHSYFIILWMLSRDPLQDRLKIIFGMLKWLIAGPFYLVFLVLSSFPAFINFMYSSSSLNSEELFTKHDVEKALLIFKTSLENQPEREEIPLAEALDLINASYASLSSRVGLGSRIVVKAAVNSTSIIKASERLRYSEHSKEVEAREAYTRLVMKLASYTTNSLNLKEAVDILQHKSLTFIKTYCRFITEKALSSIK
jgi:hypothetical protein